MHVAARVEHALSAAMALPEPSDRPIAGSVLAEELGISYPYLMTIIGPLKKAVLARVRRGPRGGLSLARPAAEITLAEVTWAVDDPFELTERVTADLDTGPAGAGVLAPLWDSAHQAVFTVFAEVPLAEVRSSAQ